MPASPGFSRFSCWGGHWPLFLGLVGLLLPAEGLAGEAAGTDLFEKSIRPVLVEHCYACHSASAKKARGGLALDTRAGLLKGGDSGPALVPGKPGESLLLKALRHDGLKMPPKARLPRTVQADFERWIEQGAPDPRGGEPARRDSDLEASRKFWSFQPPRRHPLPQMQDRSWPRSPSDVFLLAALEERGLKPAAEAARRTLGRRLSFDLVGLPPTPEEMADFLRDDSPDAYEKLVDRLLASPGFGERWGRHWLDVARYADSSGKGDNLTYHDAWRYRDYVVASFNADRPFDQFAREQVAGDLLAAPTEKERDEQLVATGFLVVGPKQLADRDTQRRRMDVVDDQIDTLGRAFLGLTLGCARCHDHKFDPVSISDYYALAGIFSSTRTLEGVKLNNPAVIGWSLRPLSGKNRLALAVRDEDKPADVRVHVRGDPLVLGARVSRGFPKVVPGPLVPAGSSGRAELARWLTQPSNPLTARVIVNRVWQHLFGEGLVRTVDNFGLQGEKPSHQDLLDTLSVEFVESGWSVKKLIRSLVLSSAYRMGGAEDDWASVIDPDNGLLWRAPRRRLEAEALRDAILAVSGRLDRSMGGSAVAGLGEKAVANGTTEAGVNTDSMVRRSIYLPVIRNDLPAVFEVFDFADPDVCTGKRDATTVPTQALFLMNSPFVQEQARATASRLLAWPARKRVERLYLLALGRRPTPAERERVGAFLSAGPGEAEETLFAVCQAVFLCTEFRFVE